MPVNNLFLVKRIYNFSNSTQINLEGAARTKAGEDYIVLLEKDFRNEALVKDMITVLEQTVKVLEKNVQDLKKEQKE